MSGFVVWFTGLSGAGKSTLGAMLAAELRHRGVPVEVLDGDEVRAHLSRGLGFSREDRDVNVRRIGFVAKLVARAGGCAITAAISPYRAVRDEQRAQIDHFVEVYCRCAVPVLAERDAKGLYKKALAGEIKHFTGIDDPYEAPEHPEVIVDTGAETRDESLARILAGLEALGYLAVAHDGGHDGPAPRRGGRALVAPHGGELCDRFAAGGDREALAAEALRLAPLALDARAESDVARIATGAFSPLQGFMGSKDHLRVTRQMRLENGLLWPVPITLAVTPAEAARLAVGSPAALRARDGRTLAVIDVTDLWAPAEAGGRVCVGGPIRVIERPSPSPYRLDPRALRAALTARGWSRVIGYHAEGVMGRAEEHLTKTALEIGDGLLIQASPTGALPADLRLRCHEALLAAHYPGDRALLSLYPEAPRDADPRAILLRALVQKNHGASHVVLDHRLADARPLFDDLAPGELGVQPLWFEEVFWSRVTGATATAKTAPGDASTRVALSAAEIEAMLARGELPPPEVMRPEVARILIEAAARGRIDVCGGLGAVGAPPGSEPLG